MDNFETILRRVVQALAPDASHTASELSDLIAEAGRRVADIQGYLDDEHKFIGDPTIDLNKSVVAQSALYEGEVELEKMRNAIPRLEVLRDARQESEDRAAKLAARASAAESYESCLKKLHALAPQFEKAAATITAYSIANRNMIDAHRALDDEPPLVEISVDHAGISGDLAAQLERVAKAMTEAVNKREQLDAAAKAYRDETPARLRRERLARDAERAAFDADHRCIIDGLGKIAVPAAMAAARRTILDGGTFEQAARAGAEAARAFVEAAKAKQAA